MLGSVKVRAHSIEQTMQRVAFDKNPDYDIYVQTDAEARRVAQSIMNNK